MTPPNLSDRTNASRPTPLPSPPILISLSSFGAAEVLRHGQLWFTRLAAEAGADGVEVRGELLRCSQTMPSSATHQSAHDELDAIGHAAVDAGLQLVYSSPDGLWTDAGNLDLEALGHGLKNARRLGAPRLKMAIGGYGIRSVDSLSLLRDLLDKTPVELVIENDQTTSAGSLSAVRTFFDDAARLGLSLGMTFDMGNWHWQGECPVLAAQTCAPRVSYVHCKGVQRQPQRWVAVPLDDSAAPWRAVLRALPAGLPMAIEYPLVGDDLLAVTRNRVEQLRGLARRAA
jgi:sugar phosphate isomerase/epimerase